MRFIKANLKDARGKDCNLRLLSQFKESGLECAEVVEYSCKNAAICASSLGYSISKHPAEYRNIRAITKNGKVYLINTIISKSDR